MSDKSDKTEDNIIEIDISEEAQQAKQQEIQKTRKFEEDKQEHKKEINPKKQKKYDEIIKKLKEENEELNNRLLRRLAEFENFKKRVYQEKENYVKEKLGKFIFDLLNILDNFDRALSHISEDEKNSSLYQGITLIDKQFHDLLDRYGVKEIDTSNGVFDPFYHQALDKEEIEEDLEKPMISKVFQKGYMFNDNVLRPTLVKVKVKKENPTLNSENNQTKKEDKKDDDKDYSNKLN